MNTNLLLLTVLLSVFVSTQLVCHTYGSEIKTLNYVGVDIFVLTCEGFCVEC